MSKLTIVIDNIPESELKKLWQYAAREAKKEFGIEIKPVETIKLDYAFIVENYYENREVITDTLSGAVSGHVVMEADKILNTQS